MKLALECPVGLIGAIGPLTDYDFLLTHLCRNPEYSSHYEKDSGRVKILDNSTNELGEPVSIDEMAAAASLIKASVVCPPDFYGDSQSTLEAVSSMASDPRFSDYTIWPIAQGSDFASLQNLLSSYSTLGFQKVAIPFDIRCEKTDALVTMGESRLEIVNLALSMNFKIHLLGMNCLEEIFWITALRSRDSIVSLDTGTPITNGLHLRKFGQDELVDKTKLLDFDYKSKDPGFDSHRMELVYYNIAYLRRMLNVV